MVEEKKAEEREEIKGTTFEELNPIPENEPWILTQIYKLQDKLAKMRKDAKRRDFENTPEGRLATQQLKELKETQQHANRVWATRWNERHLEAKRQRALELFADELLRTKYKIAADDPKVLAIMQELEELRLIVADAYYKK